MRRARQPQQISVRYISEGDIPARRVSETQYPAKRVIIEGKEEQYRVLRRPANLRLPELADWIATCNTGVPGDVVTIIIEE
ncbi:MAG: hypothetical protein AB7I42_29040 [Bradyrhizobium sp.]|uniref:hypothetical protein n=1 Tax=Bradyrhizobium sp. TaxID=376 RepID=UPI003D0BDC49